MISSSYEYDVFTWTYQTYKYICTLETNDILMDTQHRVLFEILTQEFDTLYDYTFQEVAKLNLLNLLNI